MVQVDVLWSYGIGAGFAAANTWQLEAQQAANRSAYEHTCFRDTLLFLACFFVPSGAFLIWSFPSWETMHLGSRDMPGWLVAAFTLTNATQGLLGFAVVERLLRRKRRYAGYLQWVLGYFAMFFVLVHGWDGTGYMRFFSSTRDELIGWNWGTARRWLAGDIARSLVIMGCVVIPVMFWLMVRDLRSGYQTSREVSFPYVDHKSSTLLLLSLLAALVLGCLGSAILASVAIRYFGAIFGLASFTVLAYFLGLRRGGVFFRHFRYMVYGEPFLKSPNHASAASRTG